MPLFSKVSQDLQTLTAISGRGFQTDDSGLKDQEAAIPDVSLSSPLTLVFILFADEDRDLCRKDWEPLKQRSKSTFS